jgi:1-acyl-sn-glycerol-3-phosphate acyltransferase
MFDLSVHQSAPIPAGPKIYVANHPTTIDPFLVSLLARNPSNILIAAHIFNVPVAGFFLKRLGHIPVVPGAGNLAFEKAQERLRKGKSITLFPEGSLSPFEGGFAETRTGAARLALSTGATIVPMGIHLPRERIKRKISKIDNRDYPTNWYFKGPYNITVGDPMRFEGSIEDREQVVSVAEKIMNTIKQLSQYSETRLRMS